MNFVLIDCDTSYFTSPDDLQSALGPLFGKIPVHLAVVPFHRAMGVYVPPGMDSRERFPLIQNRPLHQFLREKLSRGDVHLLQHGYDHVVVEGKGEFSSPERARRRLVPGRRALEKWFDIPVREFLPPNGQLCPLAMKLLRRQNMNVVGRISFDPRRRERDLTLITPLEYARKMLFFRRHTGLPYPWLTRSWGIFEMDCMWLMSGDRFELFDGIASRMEKIGGTICLGTHYWELQKYPEAQRALFQFVESLLGRSNVRFPRLGEVFARGA